MRDLNEIQCFVKSVELKSLTAAAHFLDLPKSSVSRKISDLEKRLGLTLILRTTRALKLTDAGREFFQTTTRALQEIESAEKGLDNTRQAIEGPLRITAPVEFSVGPLPRLVSAFLKAYPLVSIDLILTERIVDLVTENVDLAFRAGLLKDSSLIVKKMKPFSAQVVASPDYLKTRGTPKSLHEIKEHEWLKFTPAGVSMTWTLKSPDGKYAFTPKGRLGANHIFALKQAAVEGLGFAVVPNFMITEEIKAKTLRVVCPDWQVQGDPIGLVFPAQKFMAARLRTFIDYATANF
jgi:DNA-binding transcriptional LysR family regulator